MSKKIATLIGRQQEDRQGIYQLSPPFGEHEYVVCSKALGWTGEDSPGTFAGGMFGANKCELLVFPSSSGGRISNWGEIGGSYQCPGGDKQALAEMGYEIALPEPEEFDPSVERFKRLDLD
jgi:hypothetical protein